MLAGGPPAAAADTVIDLSEATVTKVIKTGVDADHVGDRISTLGDVNGDKCGDLGVSVGGGDYGPGLSVGQSSYVVYGCSKSRLIDLDSLGERGLHISQAKEIEAAGDVNGDGLADVLVHKASSSIVVFGARAKGRAAEPGTKDQWVLKAPEVTGVGDINGDGFDDLAVIFADLSAQRRGIYLVFGRRKHASLSAQKIRSGMRITRDLGQDLPRSMTGAGDVNGDGLDDLILGTRMYDRSPAAFVVLGRRSSVSVNLDHLGRSGWKMAEHQFNYYVNYSVVGPGDVNGDGLDDVVLNDEYVGNPLVVFGKRDMRDVPLDSPGRRGSHLARNGLGIGDVNGDGFDDLISGHERSVDVTLGRRHPGKRLGPSARVDVDDAIDSYVRLVGLAGGKLTHDKTPDIAVALQDTMQYHDPLLPASPGAVYIVSGRAIRKALDALSPRRSQSALGAMAGAHDIG